MIYLDTHVVAWLYSLGPAALSKPAAEALEKAEDIRISPMVRLELQFLYELGRVAEPPIAVLDELSATLGLSVCPAAFAAVVREAEGHRWTRDPFDRLIVAQAALHQAPLVTKDETLHARYSAAVW